MRFEEKRHDKKVSIERVFYMGVRHDKKPQVSKMRFKISHGISIANIIRLLFR